MPMPRPRMSIPADSSSHPVVGLTRDNTNSPTVVTAEPTMGKTL